MNEYNEDEALKQYLWRNYAELGKPHECVPADDYILAALPREFRDEYQRHTEECKTIIDTGYESARQYLGTDCIEILPDLPALRSELSRLVFDIIRKYQSDWAKSVLAANREKIHIVRCQQCNAVMISPTSRHCLHCGLRLARK